MEKFSFNLFIFVVILIFATHSEMMAEGRGPVISCNAVKSKTVRVFEPCAPTIIALIIFVLAF
ncbi:hypothetical protein ERO13_A12G147325v2 [Gossypium hirsutum]|nr:hypothetical protein ERO13_A12G147325v2 [Gossypium hirsutum]